MSPKNSSRRPRKDAAVVKVAIMAAEAEAEATVVAVDGSGFKRSDGKIIFNSSNLPLVWHLIGIQGRKASRNSLRSLPNTVAKERESIFSGQTLLKLQSFNGGIKMVKHV